jgi:hypothetical protein
MLEGGKGSAQPQASLVGKASSNQGYHPKGQQGQEDHSPGSDIQPFEEPCKDPEAELAPEAKPANHLVGYWYCHPEAELGLSIQPEKQLGAGSWPTKGQGCGNHEGQEEQVVEGPG